MTFTGYIEGKIDKGNYLTTLCKWLAKLGFGEIKKKRATIVECYDCPLSEWTWHIEENDLIRYRITIGAEIDSKVYLKAGFID